MTYPILYPDEGGQQIHRHSSIDQFNDFLSVWKQGGWAPIVFDQLDGIKCEAIKTHPVVISWGKDLGYIFPEAHCTFISDKFVYFDRTGVEQRILPSVFGGNGELFPEYVNKNSFVNYDNGNSVGVRSEQKFRTGLSYVTADETLPAAG